MLDDITRSNHQEWGENIVKYTVKMKASHRSNRVACLGSNCMLNIWSGQIIQNIHTVMFLSSEVQKVIPNPCKAMVYTDLGCFLGMWFELKNKVACHLNPGRFFKWYFQKYDIDACTYVSDQDDGNSGLWLDYENISHSPEFPSSWSLT
jgi:hypothetical protein